MNIFFMLQHEISILTFTFVGLGLLLLKHFILDFPLQTPYQWQNKHIYGHPGGLLHSGLHAGVTTLILLPLFFISPIQIVVDSAWWLLAGTAMFEFLIHYHCDWWKMNHCKKHNLDPKTTAAFWTVTGFDQWVHYMTYWAILWFWMDTLNDANLLLYLLLSGS